MIKDCLWVQKDQGKYHFFLAQSTSHLVVYLVLSTETVDKVMDNFIYTTIKPYI